MSTTEEMRAKVTSAKAGYSEFGAILDARREACAGGPTPKFLRSVKYAEEYLQDALTLLDEQFAQGPALMPEVALHPAAARFIMRLLAEVPKRLGAQNEVG